MSGVVTNPADVSARRSGARAAARIGAFVALGLGLGAAAGVLWGCVVDLPVYKIASDGAASTTERGLTEFFGGDAWFVCHRPAGRGRSRDPRLATGFATWAGRWCSWSGLTASAPGCCAGWWATGSDPGEFTPRLAAAQAGDLVPIELTLRARASLLAWPFFAVIPVLLGSSLGRDDEDPTPLLRRRRSGNEA